MKYTIKELAELSQTHKPGVEEEALVHTEQELGSRFPEQYRDLVKITNSRSPKLIQIYTSCGLMASRHQF